MSGSSPALPPGFRFHPTDEELILHYLCKRAASAPCPVAIIADINIYKFNPWDLPAKAKFGETEWYFFSPRDRKYPNGVRPNRAAASGYWKATGTDKPIRIGSSRNANIGVKKALVFYKGKPPNSVKTNWIMHEYRLADALHTSNHQPVKLTDASMRLDDWVLCRIYQKSSCHKSQAEPDKEDPTKEHAELQNPTSRNTIHRSFSLSELLMEETDFSLLSRLLGSPTDAPLTDHAPLSNLNYSNGSYLNSQVRQLDASVLTADNSLKRQRAVDNYFFDECGGHLNHFKKLSSSHNSAQFDNQFDLSQPFFTQQLLLNSDHLGMN